MTHAIDSHVHVWTDDLERYPRAAGAREYPPMRFTVDDFLVHARPNGVSRAVLVQMSFYGRDHSYLLAVLRDHPGQFAGVGLIDPASESARQEMDRLAARGIRAFRISPNQLGDWDSVPLRGAWRHAGAHGFAMCPLINPDALGALASVCEEFPDTAVVIDHLARIGAAGEVREEEVRALCNLAKYPRVCVKVSAFYALGLKRAPYEDLAPLIRRVGEAFGASRLMWGSDCPFQVENGHTYSDSLALIRDRLPFLSDTDRQCLLGGTASRVFFASI